MRTCCFLCMIFPDLSVTSGNLQTVNPINYQSMGMLRISARSPLILCARVLCMLECVCSPNQFTKRTHTGPCASWLKPRNFYAVPRNACGYFTKISVTRDRVEMHGFCQLAEGPDIAASSQVLQRSVITSFSSNRHPSHPLHE